MDEAKADRRPIAARGSRFAGALTAMLLRTSITPNQISLLSIGFAALGAWALWQAPVRPWLFLVALAGIQLRLLCNLLDGMVAVEGGRGSPLGALYNEFPDRVADSLLLVALGYAAGWPWLGWACALVAALTAYVRLMGGALGQPQVFAGMMAKQHRMAVLSVGCVMALILPVQGVLQLMASMILFGSLATCITRTRIIAGRLRAPATHAASGDLPGGDPAGDRAR